MAKTDDVVGIREILKVGDISFRRANSESIMKRFAATNNFIAKYQTDYHSFFLNGSYGVASGLIGYDGAYTCFTKSKVVGVAIWNAISGTSGTTDLDIHWIDQAGVDQGSIFSTTPKINSSSANATRGFRNFTTTNDFTMTGVTLPSLSKDTFLEGETLYLKVNSAMTQAQNCALTLNILPIT